MGHSSGYPSACRYCTPMYPNDDRLDTIGYSHLFSATHYRVLTVTTVELHLRNVLISLALAVDNEDAEAIEAALAAAWAVIEDTAPSTS